MPSRRSHSNSHHGCKQCKQRRVKCDESRPTCLRCQRQKSDCTYTSIGPLSTGGAAATFAITSLTQISPAHQAPGPVLTPLSASGTQTSQQLPLPPPLPLKHKELRLQQQQQLQFHHEGPPQGVQESYRHHHPPISQQSTQPSPQAQQHFQLPYTTAPQQQPQHHHYSPYHHHHVSASPPQGYRNVPKAPKTEPSDTTGPPTPSSTTSAATGIRISSLLSPPSPATQGSPAAGSTSTGSIDSHRWELRLMHHWAAETVEIVSTKPAAVPVWRDNVVNEALEHEFLLHALFSLSAFHLAYQQTLSEQRHVYLEVAYEHHNLSVALANSALTNINTRNCHAMFALSCLVAMTSFVLPHMTLTEKPRDPLREVVDGFYLWRGTSTVVQSSFDMVAQGPLAGLFYFPDKRFNLDGLPQDAKASFQLLSETASSLKEEETTKESYAAAISELCVSYAVCHAAATARPGPVRAESALFGWPILVSAQMMDNLKNSVPMALAILAHYAVVLYELNDVWWAAGWGPELFDAVDSRLDDSWDACLRWPREQIKRPAAT